MKKEQKEQIGEVIDRLENLICALTMAIPDNIHVECLKETLPEIKEQLKDVLKQKGKTL